MKSRQTDAPSERFFPRSTLRTKLYLVYTVPLLVVVMTTLLFASQRRIKSLQEQQIAIADALVQALTQNLRRIALFGDQALWADLSTLLASFPDIEYLVAYDRQERRLFYYGRSGLPVLRTPPKGQDGAAVVGDHLHLLRVLPAVKTGNGQALHRVYLRQDCAHLRRQAESDRGRILIFGLGLAALALLGSVAAHRVLILPIEGLARLARQIADSQEYHLRSGLRRSDEIGTLGRGFDHLLGRISEELARRNRSARERERLILELEQRNTNLSQFAHSVSHDLRNPLVTIRVFTDRLQEDFAAGKTARAVSDLGRIGKAAGRMSRLLEDLLELSCSGRVIRPPEVVDLGPLLQALLDDLVAVREAVDAQITVHPNLPSVLADRSRIRSVFQNLIENALKFSPQRPCIEIGARLDGDMVLCHVRDHGLGIDPQYHRRVFDLFERLTPEMGGTGIGLALVQRITEAHGGRVWVESEGEGHGSTFFLTLPQAEQVSKDLDPQEEPEIC